MGDDTWIVSVSELVNRIGFPAAVAIMLGVGIVSIIRWFRPWGEKLFVAHITGIETLSETSRRQANTQSDTLRVLQELHNLHKGSRKALGHIGEAIVEAAPKEAQPAVRQIIQRAHESLNDG